MAPNGTLSMRRQCALLAVTRSSVYYEPVVPDAEELALMRRIDELHLQHPFFGSRMITQTLKADALWAPFSASPPSCRSPTSTLGLSDSRPASV